MRAGAPWRALLHCSSGPPAAFHLSPSSSGEPDDWEQSGSHLALTDGGTMNAPYLPEEEEEEDEDDAAEVEPGQERGIVTVRSPSEVTPPAGQTGFFWRSSFKLA